MSELAVGSLKGLAANSFVIDVASGSKIVQPGAILQVVSTTKTDTFTTTSESFTDVTGYNLSITPSSTTSKVLVIFDYSWSNTGAGRAGARILRGVSEPYQGNAAGSRILGTSSFDNAAANSDSADNHTWHRTAVFLDSPATASAINYKLQFIRLSGSATVVLNRKGQDADTTQGFRTASSITLIEVAG
jgi:hypothetical protein